MSEFRVMSLYFQLANGLASMTITREFLFLSWNTNIGFFSNKNHEAKINIKNESFRHQCVIECVCAVAVTEGEFV